MMVLAKSVEVVSMGSAILLVVQFLINIGKLATITMTATKI